MLHPRARRRNPVAAVFLTIFLLLMLVAWLGVAGALILLGVVAFVAVLVRGERSRHGRRD